MYAHLGIPNIAIPYTNRSALQESILKNQYGLVPKYYYLEGDYAYHNLMADLWRKRETVIIIEHDILPWPGAIEELMMCQCEWGAYSYITNRRLGVQHMLGCCKITAELMNRLPDIWNGENLIWWDIDKKLMEKAASVLIEPHLHRPPVIHINQRELR